MNENTVSAEIPSKFLKIKKITKKALFIIGGISFLIFLFFILLKSPKQTASNSISTQKAEVAAPKKTAEISRDFSFPIQNESNKEVGKIKYYLENAQLQDEIIVKGQKAYAVEGRTFLILNLKISNELKQPLNINTRDYVRLSIDDNESDLLAPDIHNDPVEVQAISTKLTRVGFPINEKYKSLKLKIGDINGEKTSIDLKF